MHDAARPQVIEVPCQQTWTSKIMETLIWPRVAHVFFTCVGNKLDGGSSCENSPSGADHVCAWESCELSYRFCGVMAKHCCI